MKSLGGVELPAQTRWAIDRNNWSAVGMTTEYFLSGALEVSENVRSGRPIVLSWERRIAYLPQATVDGLMGLINQIGVTHTLDWDGPTTPVIFDRPAGPLQLSRILRLHDAWIGELHLIEVTA